MTGLCPVDLPGGRRGKPRLYTDLAHYSKTSPQSRIPLVTVTKELRNSAPSSGLSLLY